MFVAYDKPLLLKHPATASETSGNKTKQQNKTTKKEDIEGEFYFLSV